MPPDLAIALCTHNPRQDFLSRVLASLRAQSRAVDTWELIVVDNASTNGVVGACDLSWHPRARVCIENRLGITFARLRAIEECDAELLLFVDDDNILRPDYLERVRELTREHLQVAVFGAGIIELEFEVAPSPELAPYLYLLGMRSFKEPLWSNDPRDHRPYGMGMVVRRAVFEGYREAVLGCGVRQQLGRRGSQLHSGEDDEFSWVACRMGFGKGLFPELGFRHLIAKHRVEKEYLLRLAEGSAFSGLLLDWLHHVPLPARPEKSSPMKVLGAILQVSPTIFFDEGSRWWRMYRRKALDIDFDRARDQGVCRALDTIRQFEQHGMHQHP